MTGGTVTLPGSIALVTGAMGGIGAAVTRSLRAAGATVVTCDLAGTGADLVADVTRGRQVEAAVAEVIHRHGRLDVVVANAGIAVAGLTEDLTESDWRRTLEVNLWGVVTTVRAAYPLMVEQRRGHIVAVASLAGLAPSPLLTAYAASKHGVVGLATSLRPEAARHGVGVSVVCPGPIETPLLDDAPRRTPGLDVRRYLTAAAGPALPPRTIGDAVVRAIERDRAVVTPGRAAVASRIARTLPGLMDRLAGRGLAVELAAAERADQPSSTASQRGSVARSQ